MADLATITTISHTGRVRTWTIDREAAARYRTALLTSPTSLLPGLTALEAAAAAAYVGTLPMCRDRSIVDTWLALGADVRHMWVERTRRDLEAAS